jgi:hypothetical protein
VNTVASLAADLRGLKRGDAMRAKTAVGALMLLVGLLGAGARAAEEGPLPVFRVLSPDGRPIASSELTAQSRWVMLYIAPGCAPCDDLLRATGSWQPQALPGRIVVLIRGTLTDAAAYVEKNPPRRVATVAWFADAGDEAWQALKLTGTPVLIGVQDGEMKWSIAGVLNDPQMVDSVVRTWLER